MAAGAVTQRAQRTAGAAGNGVNLGGGDFIIDAEMLQCEKHWARTFKLCHYFAVGVSYTNIAVYLYHKQTQPVF